jgi:hypothetical protein
MPPSSTGSSTGASVARWTGSVVVLVIAALLGGLAVVAGYLRSEVLDTEAYVQTVAPLASDPAVRDALAQRLTTEIIVRTDIKKLATSVATGLVDRGLPPALDNLVEPAVAGLTSFLDDKIKQLLATPQFEQIWESVNRAAHEGLVTDLTGRNGRLQHSSGTTITIDLGQVLSEIKDKLVDDGLTFVKAVPNVSIPFTLIESDALPKIRTYTRILDVVGTWLPYAALLVFLGGVLIAPNRRRGAITGVAMLGVFAVLLLAAIAVVRRLYLDRLPANVQSPDAAAALFDAVIAFLIAALQALLVAIVVTLLVLLLAGPNRFAVWLRRQGGRVLDSAGRGLGRAGTWTERIGAALKPVRRPLEVGLLLVGAVIYILANRPSAGGVLILAACLIAVFLLIEVFARVRPPDSIQPPAEPA